MAKILISYAREDFSIVQRLIAEITKSNHDVYLDQQSIKLGDPFQQDIRNKLKNVDVFLALVTKNSDNSHIFNNEVSSAVSYLSHSNREKLILPVVLDKESISNSDLTAFQALFGRTDDFEKLVHEIENIIGRFEGVRLAQEEINASRGKVLEDESTDYINETIDDLKAREKTSRRLASRWHLAGYSALVLSVIFVFILWVSVDNSFTQPSLETNRIVFDAIKGVTIVALLLGLARYSFLLAKTHQLEALKNADRLHAISFGKFYMRVFSTQISQTEIKEVFQHWNTSGSSDLSHLDVEKIDSRLAEVLSKVFDKLDIKTKP